MRFYVLVAALALAAAQPPPPPPAGPHPGAAPRVTMTGSGLVFVSPDEARVSLTFSVFQNASLANSSLASAATRVGEQADAFLSALDALGVARANTTQTSFTTRPRFEYFDGRAQLVGFDGVSSFATTLGNVTLAAAVINSAGDAGAVDGVSFAVSPAAEAAARLVALELAGADARRRAGALARGAGGGALGAVLALHEAGADGDAPRAAFRALAMPSMARAAVADSALASEGLVPVGAGVVAVFELIAGA
jgi:uncharacterized protein YggE